MRGLWIAVLLIITRVPATNARIDIDVERFVRREVLSTNREFLSIVETSRILNPPPRAFFSIIVYANNIYTCRIILRAFFPLRGTFEAFTKKKETTEIKQDSIF